MIYHSKQCNTKNIDKAISMSKKMYLFFFQLLKITLMLCNLSFSQQTKDRVEDRDIIRKVHVIQFKMFLKIKSYLFQEQKC